MPASKRATIVSATAATTVAALPVALIGSMAVLIRADLTFGQTQLGLLVAAFSAVAAVASVPISRRLTSENAAPVLAWCAAGSSAVMAGIAVAVSAWWQLVLFMALAGAASVATQLAANQLIADRVVPQQQGVAFGLKQAAVPLGALVAGLLMPAVGLTFGWRWAFGGAAALAVTVAIVVPSWIDSRTSSATLAVSRRIRRRPWIILAIASGCAGAAGNTLAPFIIGYAITSGFSTPHAGLLLAAGAGAGVFTRVGAGIMADHIGHGALLLMIGLLGVGVMGVGLLAFASNPAMQTAGVLLAFSGAWGWAGVLLLAISRVAASTVASAMGIVAVGPLMGAVVGPPAFGWLVENVSWDAAWAGMIAVILMAVSLVSLSRRELKMMLIDEDERLRTASGAQA